MQLIRLSEEQVAEQIESGTLPVQEEIGGVLLYRSKDTLRIMIQSPFTGEGVEIAA